MKTTSQTITRGVLYGGASVLLMLDIFFLAKAIVQDSFLPIIPIVAGAFITGGMLFIIYAEQKNREQDKQEHRRLSRVAHQLENPLQVLEDDLAYITAQAHKMPAEERLKLKRMQTKTKALLENVRDVFLMLEAQSGMMRMEVGTYDLCVLVREAVAHIKPLASARNVEITEKAHCSHAPVSIDRRLFLIALIHMLENAVLYTLTPGLVNVAIVRGNKFVRIIIQDRGIGIVPRDAQAVFLPFARGEKAEQFDSDGIGVGLTLAKYIIQHMKGKLHWQPREGATGTEFEIVLPVVTK